MFVDGCLRDWQKLPNPESPFTVGIDGGYIHAREGKNMKAGWFEAIVGKSLQKDRKSKRFGFVVDYDKKPKRRLYDMLEKEGLQMNQGITFLSDGEDTVQNLQSYITLNSEHILDWFHITMKITVMRQLAKSVRIDDKHFKINEELDRAKWYIWHGNVYKALEAIDSLREELEMTFYDKKEGKGYKLWKYSDEFYNYINNNGHYIINYGERYRHGEIISSAFVESTVNELISKRMVKKQQMRWTKEGAHLLLQVRTKTLNDELKETFCNWYPKMEQDNEQYSVRAA